MARIRKTYKGRQRIEMTKISKESNLQVTFSKRRYGLFKKASELCTLTGAEIAVLTFSPSQKVFSFGSPNVNSVVDQFRARNASQTLTPFQRMEANQRYAYLNMQLTESVDQLKASKNRGEELAQRRNWSECPPSELGKQRLLELKMAMEDLNEKITNETDAKLAMAASIPFFQGSSSSRVGQAGPSMTPHEYALGYGHGYSYV